jgi:hypothetical protein
MLRNVGVRSAHPNLQNLLLNYRFRTGIAFAGNRATSIPPSRIGAPASGAHAIAVIVSHVAGKFPSLPRNGS